MTVANGREFLSIPGPTNVPDAVLAAMHRTAIDIYSGDMLRVTHTLLEDLPRIFRTACQQRALARRDGARPRKRPVRRGLGRDGADDGAASHPP
jgi:hypothetical protein